MEEENIQQQENQEQNIQQQQQNEENNTQETQQQQQSNEQEQKEQENQNNNEQLQEEEQKVENNDQENSSNEQEQEEEERDYEKENHLIIGDEKQMKEKQKQAEELRNYEDEDYSGLTRKEIPKYEKNLGKEAFVKKNYEQATKHYAKALLAVDYLIKDGQVEDQEEMIGYIEEIQVPCNLNLSICYMNMKGGYSLGASYAGKALELDENNIKGLYRRAKCNIYLGNFDDARTDLKKAYNLEPTSKEIQSCFELLQIRKKQQAERSKKAYQNVLQGMNYSEGQQAGQSTAQPQNQNQNKEQINFTFMDKVTAGLQIVKLLAKDKASNILQSVQYNARVVLLTPLNFVTERCCKRRIPSQFYKQKKN